MKQNNSKLRFAALRRVSTEQQEKIGESLLTQKTEIEKAVKQLGGEIVEWYGGQEHATYGHEKKEINRLLNDAQKKERKFNAFIITNADRWSRDNQKSKQGLDVFIKQGIKFFVGISEYNLFDPTQLFYLEMSSVIGGFQARNQKQKSLLNRIHRAKRGLPTCGKKPFGRTFDKDTGKWGIDETKKRDIEDIAKRYLASEKLPYLAEEYKMNHANLHKILTKRSGDTWEQTFNSDDLNIHKTIKTKVPRLLPEKTILAIKKKAQANKTYSHGQLTNSYLLSRMIFCKHCGYAMFGQINHHTTRYYRHAHSKRVKKCCSPKGYIPAEEIEDIVMCHLFECFGNPLAVEKAIEKAIPNLKKMQEHQNRLERIETELLRLGKGREKILRLVVKESVSEIQAEKQLSELNQKETNLQTEQDRLHANLDNNPSSAKIKTISKKVSTRFKRSVRLGTVRRKAGTKPYSEMTYEEKRALLELIFSGNMPDGRRMGIYIEWNDRKDWKFDIHGHLIDEEGLVPMSDSMKEAYFGNLEGGGYNLHVHKKLLTKSASY